MKLDDKLRELILYVAQKASGDPTFGKVKLYKVLFYADFGAYAATLRSITGEEYRKFPRGPVPARAQDVLDDLEETGEVEVASQDYHGKAQLRVQARREPDLTLFTADELRRVDSVITDLWGKTATTVSEESHGHIGWKAALSYEVIPYETALLDDSPLTEEETQWAQGLVAAGR